MKIIKIFSLLFLPVLVLITLLPVDGYRPSLAENPELSTVTFYVQWFDVGKAALEGLDGIKQIDKGFYNLKEVNTVHYDASAITTGEMEDALKKARTYQGTIKQNE